MWKENTEWGNSNYESLRVHGNILISRNNRQLLANITSLIAANRVTENHNFGNYTSPTQLAEQKL